jgi:copper homeostasis protein
MKKNQLEIACFNYESAIIAQEAGADRIELCDNMKLGGTTPNPILAVRVREKLSIKMHVIIRPRGGNFVYTDDEFVEMKQDIKQFKKLGVDGFVFGILKENGNVNKRRNKELVNMAHPLPCTFHRAFVEEGIFDLEKIQKWAKDKIEIMPGGGLRSSNIKLLQDKLEPTFYHSSAITDNSETANPEEIKELRNFL